ncbi:hypothetical protein [Burkholderia glumae]|uniref:hypothetical protein n=1 Tax=Burkholderia glumae TaxID=337 RepID=UPI00214A2AB8|nr:hypothetical protein [Burkholderia glumae]MCR1768924.1 hypothetical protein [Burkholderia glumae]
MTNAIYPVVREKTIASGFESPVFEIIEDFKVESKLYKDGTTVRVLLRRQLNHRPSRFSLGPYWLDLRVGAHHMPHYCVPEATAREAACRFLLKHTEGVAPLLN